jgi:RHS repeat-associated protein
MRRGESRHQPLRLPGQVADDGAELYQNVFRWYRPTAGRYTQSDPIGFRGGLNLFAYADGNPVRWSDRLGLKVYKCCAPAQIAAGLIDHCWLKTETREAGLGDLDVGQPAGQAAAVGDRCGGSPFVTQTQVVDHTGSSTSRAGANCTEIKGVDEQCVNDQIWTDSRGYGATQGAWTPTNQCQSFVHDVLQKCKKKCPPPPIFPTPFGPCATVNGRTVCAATGI